MKMMWEIVAQMVARGFIASDLYVTVEPAIIEARKGSQHTVLDGRVDEHIDSIPERSYQGCAENIGDGYGSEVWQTFPHVKSTEERKGPNKCMKDSIYLMMSCMGAHLKMKMITDLVIMQPISMLLGMTLRSS